MGAANNSQYTIKLRPTAPGDADASAGAKGGARAGGGKAAAVRVEHPAFSAAPGKMEGWMVDERKAAAAADAGACVLALRRLLPNPRTSKPVIARRRAPRKSTCGRAFKLNPASGLLSCRTALHPLNANPRLLTKAFSIPPPHLIHMQVPRSGPWPLPLS